MSRLVLEIEAPDVAPLSLVVPEAVCLRTLRLGYQGDLALPLPGEITLRVKRGKVYVASLRHEVPAELGGLRIPAWPVPVPLPCHLSIGATQLSLRLESRPVPVPVPVPVPDSRRPPYLADRVMLATFAMTRRALHAFGAEWRSAGAPTKLAFATVLAVTVAVATRL